MHDHIYICGLWCIKTVDYNANCNDKDFHGWRKATRSTLLGRFRKSISLFFMTGMHDALDILSTWRSRFIGLTIPQLQGAIVLMWQSLNYEAKDVRRGYFEHAITTVLSLKRVFVVAVMKVLMLDKWTKLLHSNIIWVLKVVELMSYHPLLPIDR